MHLNVYLPELLYYTLTAWCMLLLLQEEMLVPAINGTLNVLKSCKKNPFLKRVVLTSSSSTVRIRDESKHPEISLDETIWSSVALCEKLQVKSPFRFTDYLHLL
jgi:hypothetical protein